MRARLTWASGVAALLLAVSPTAGAGPSANHDAQALAKKIAQHTAKRWAEAKVEPAPLADDAEFLRRVYLDLAERIPSVAETRAFLGDRRSDKRARLVEQLLTGSRYVAHFTNVWRARLLPE